MNLPVKQLESVLKHSDKQSLARTIVNAPFDYRVEMVTMGLGIIVLLINRPAENQIHRVALSQTELAEGTTRISLKKFEDIKIPTDDPQNIISKAIRDREPQSTQDWKYLFTPALSPEQARLNQAGGGIACSVVCPLYFGSDSGALIFSYYKEVLKIGETEQAFMRAYSQIVQDRLALEASVQDMILVPFADS